MLSSLLKIEQQLKCDICLSTLNQATGVGECEHRFCFECVSEKLPKASECPTCKIPTKPENLYRDHLHDNLVDYIDQIKRLSLNHTLTPMELSYETNSSLYKTQDESGIVDLIGKRKQSEDLTSRKKPTTDQDVSKFLDDLVQVPIVDQDVTMKDANQDSESSDSSQETTRERWKCPDCLFSNPIYIQTCGICRKYKNTSIIQTKVDHTKTIPYVEIEQTYEPTIATDEPTEESATITPIRTQSPESKRSKEVHVMYTGLTSEDEASLDKLINNVLDTKLKISVHYKMRDFGDVTHVITSVDKDKLCKRTLKYLQGILEGKWIMTSQWLFESIDSHQWLPEEQYEVKGDHVTGPTQGPSRGRDRQKNNKNALFEDMKFYFFGDFSGKHNKNDLLVLCRSGGGKILGRKPNGLGHRIDAKTDPLNPKEPIVIMCTEKKKPTSSWLYESQVRDPSWIIECISKLAIV